MSQYALVGSASDKVCDILAVHEHNEREPGYFVTEAVIMTMARLESNVSWHSGKTKRHVYAGRGPTDVLVAQATMLQIGMARRSFMATDVTGPYMRRMHRQPTISS